MKYYIGLLLLVINAIFWGMGSHAQHCQLAGLFGSTFCPPHWVHLLIGVVSFLSAVYISQYEYVNSLMQ